MRKFYIFIAFLFFSIATISLYNLIFLKKSYYEELYQDKTSVYVSSLSRPRGRILDINGNILVDNIGVKAIVYRKVNNISVKEEISVAYKLAEMLEISESTSLNDLKKFFLITAIRPIT